jgi:hypothetical protein
MTIKKENVLTRDKNNPVSNHCPLIFIIIFNSRP